MAKQSKTPELRTPLYNGQNTIPDGGHYRVYKQHILLAPFGNGAQLAYGKHLVFTNGVQYHYPLFSQHLYTAAIVCPCNELC